MTSTTYDFNSLLFHNLCEIFYSSRCEQNPLMIKNIFLKQLPKKPRPDVYSESNIKINK